MLLMLVTQTKAFFFKCTGNLSRVNGKLKKLKKDVLVDLAQVLHLPFALVKLRGKAVLNTRVYSLSNVTACINNRYVEIVSYLYCSNVIMTAVNSVEQAHALTNFFFELCFFSP